MVLGAAQSAPRTSPSAVSASASAQTAAGRACAPAACGARLRVDASASTLHPPIAAPGGPSVKPFRQCGRRFSGRRRPRRADGSRRAVFADMKTTGVLDQIMVGLRGSEMLPQMLQPGIDDPVFDVAFGPRGIDRRAPRTSAPSRRRTIRSFCISSSNSRPRAGSMRYSIVISTGPASS